MQANYKNQKSLTKLCLGLALFLTQLSFSQAAYYTFSKSEGTYLPLTDATVIATATGASGNTSLDDVSYNGIAIPFDFNFNSQTYTALNINTNGYISFGTPPTGASPISSGGSADGVIAPLGIDLNGMLDFNGKTATIETKLIGTAPNRSFVIEWKHFKPYQNTLASHFDFNFQAHLNEDGTIQFVYDLSFAGTPTGTNAKVGLRGNTASDYTNRTASGNTTSNWSNTTAGSYSSDGIATNRDFLPSSGFTITWSTPLDCETPTTQPTNLVLTNTGIIINGSFTASNPVADRYLILRNMNGETPNPPTDGTVYTLGQNNNLNAYVAYYGAGTTFESNYNNGIKGNNEYSFTVYAVNTACAGGPLYLTTEPITGSITNCPIGVNGITNTNITEDSFQLNWPTSENGDALPFSTIIEVATNNTFTNMVEGSPFTLESTQLSLLLEGLNPNTQYFYRGKNVSDCESSYSSIGNIFTSCVTVSDFYENFDAGTGLAVPNCWSKILTSANSSTPTINVTTTDASSQPNNVSFYGDGANTDLETTKIILVSPAVSNLAAGTHRLRFKARKTSTTTTPSATSLQIVALDANDANASIEIIATFNELTTAYTEYNAYFDNYSGDGSYIGIRRIGGPTYSYLYVDDIIWEAIPSCPDLVSITASSFTPNGASVTWVDPADQVPANGYEYFVATTNTPPAADADLTETNSNTINLTNLLSGTTYYFWVRRVCSTDEKSPWKSTSFATVLTTPAPWTEPFATSAVPAGWSSSGWSFATQRGAIGNTGNNINKNLYNNAPTGTFTTIPVGPLNTTNYELSFDYKQSNYSSPYAPLADWGDFQIEISTDFGTTWNILGNADNESGSGSYTNKTYSLSAYANQYVKIRVTGNWTAGDFDLSFDNFKITAQDLNVDDFNKNNLKLYPNPTTDFVTVQTDSPIKNIQIFNQLGQLITAQKDSKINLSDATAGIYIVHVTLEDGTTVTQKIIKK